MTDGITRVTLISPAGDTVQVAEDQVDRFLDAGWEKPSRRGSRRADTGSVPVQQQPPGSAR